MIDYHQELVAALKTVLPDTVLPDGEIQRYVHYEMVLESGLPTPCYSYMETNNYVSDAGTTLGYSRIRYQVKVWATDIATIQKYALMADEVLRPLGFVRTAANELYDNNSSMIQKILTYEATGLEEY